MNDELNDAVKNKMLAFALPKNIVIRKIIAYADGDVAMNYSVDFFGREVIKNVYINGEDK
jgi:hypothetical protein